MAKREFKIEVDIPEHYDNALVYLEIWRHLTASGMDYIDVIYAQAKAGLRSD